MTIFKDMGGIVQIGPGHDRALEPGHDGVQSRYAEGRNPWTAYNWGQVSTLLLESTAILTIFKHTFEQRIDPWVCRHNGFLGCSDPDEEQPSYLVKVPREILEQIVEEVALADGWGGVVPYLKKHYTKVPPYAIGRMFTKLRLNHHLASTVANIFKERVEYFRRQLQLDPEQYSSLSREALKTYDTLSICMTSPSLKKLKTAAKNADLATLITDIKYSACDFDSRLAEERLFDRNLHAEITRMQKSRYDRLTPEAQRIYRAKKYEKHLCHFAEHQKFLQHDADLNLWNAAFQALTNLKNVSFTRLSSWEHDRVEYPTSTLTTSAEARKQSPEALRNPEYWRGFLRLLGVISKYHRLDTIVLNQVCPDLSLVPASELTSAASAFRGLKTLWIACEPDADFWRPKSRMNRPDNWWDEEVAAWNHLITTEGSLQSLFITMSDYMSREYNPPEEYNCLVSLLLEHVSFGSPIHLKIGGMSNTLELDTYVLEDFLKRNGTRLQRMLLAPVRFIQFNHANMVEEARIMLPILKNITKRIKLCALNTRGPMYALNSHDHTTLYGPEAKTCDTDLIQIGPVHFTLAPEVQYWWAREMHPRLVERDSWA